MTVSPPLYRLGLSTRKGRETCLRPLGSYTRSPDVLKPNTVAQACLSKRKPEQHQLPHQRRWWVPLCMQAGGQQEPNTRALGKPRASQSLSQWAWPFQIN